MTYQPPPPRPRPAPRRRPTAPAAAAAPPNLKWWKFGWMEWFFVSQTFLPALLFLPGVSAIRTPLRVSTYLVSLVMWVMVIRSGRKAKADDRFLARSWLLFALGFLGLMLANPANYSMPTALAQVMLYITVAAPAFWVSKVLDSPKQLGKALAVLFLCNSASTLVGIAQFYRPETFNPPVIPALNNIFQGEDLKYDTPDGRRVLRPCGLTDSPGGVSPAAGVAAMLGLCMAVKPIGLIRRGICVGLAFAGLAVIYLTHVRQMLVMTVFGLLTVTILLTLQRNYRQAMTLAVGAVACVVGAMAYVVRSAGTATLNRFMTLLGDDPTNLYYRSRGGYIDYAVDVVLPQNPIGLGLGWWGMTHGMFADPNRITPVWCEVMVVAWIYDGGFPLLIAYGGAVILALIDTARVALTTTDSDLGLYAAAVLAMNMGITVTCLSFTTFLAPVGLTFWSTTALIHAADAQVRAARTATPRPAPRPAPPPRPGMARR